MMININKFDNQVEKIKNDAKNYEINVYQTLSVIKNMTQYWNDGYTKAFFRKVDQMLSGTNETTDFIYNIISYLKIISSDYNITNYRRGRIFGYSDSTINSDHFIIYNGDDEETANKKSIISNSIIENENHIESVVFKLCKPNTQKMDFENLDKDSIEQNEYVGMLGNMNNEIKQLEQKKQDTVNASDKLNDSFAAIVDLYNSKNTKKINQAISDVADSLYIINNNIEKAYEYVITRKEKYKSLFSDITASTSTINDND